MASTLKHLTTNLRARARRETWNGRSWLVAPATLIVPDRVLNGSRGRLLYPKAEALKSPSSWDGVPLLLRHPEGNRSGQDALPSQGLGLWRNTTANGRLSGEAWFDEELVKHRDADLPPNQKILPRLLDGRPIELSTGLMTDDDETPGVLANGERYDATATNYRPDHVAILPDAKGACAVEHGCGVFNAEGEQLGSLDLCSACGGDLDATGKCKACGYKSDEVLNEAAFFARFWSWLTGNANPKSSASGRWKPWGSGTGKGDAHEAAQRGRLVLTADDQAKGADAKQQADAGYNPPGWAVDEDKWEKAKAAADKGEYGPETYWAVVASIYQRMGGTVGEAKTDNESNEPASAGNTNEEEADMATKTKAENVQQLTTNCECWRGKADTLNKLTDAEVQAIADAEAKHVANAKKAKTLDALKHRIANAVEMEKDDKGHGCEGDAEDPDCKAMFAAMSENASAAAKKKIDAKKAKEDAADGGADDDEEDAEGNKVVKVQKVTKNQTRKPRTVGEWLDTTDAPDAVKSVVRNAERVERDERERLTGILRGIAKNEEGDPKVRRLIENKLAQKPQLDLGQLEELVVLTRPVRNQRSPDDDDDENDRRPTRNGAQGSWQLTENERGETLDIGAAREEQGYMKPRQAAKTG